LEIPQITPLKTNYFHHTCKVKTNPEELFHLELRFWILKN